MNNESDKDSFFSIEIFKSDLVILVIHHIGESVLGEMVQSVQTFSKIACKQTMNSYVKAGFKEELYTFSIMFKSGRKVEEVEMSILVGKFISIDVIERNVG